jgi:hypothetical protein
MYAFLNHSSQCLYKNYIQIGRLLRNRRGFRDGCFTFNYRQRYARKDNSVLTPALLVPDPLLSVCRS